MDMSDDEENIFSNDVQEEFEGSGRTLKINTEDLLEFEVSSEYQIKKAGEAGVKDFAIFISAKGKNSVPKKPYNLKCELEKKVQNHAFITKCLNTRNGRLLITTSKNEAAIEIAKITSILGIEVETKLQVENITSQFMLNGIATDVKLSKLADELKNNGLQTESIRRFNKKGSSEKSENVLVRVYGHFLPPDIKVFLSNIKIRRFVDSVRQCRLCFKFTHSTAKCNVKKPICRRCGEEHEHAEENCTNELKCANCNLPHFADEKKDRVCPSREEEKKFLKFKADSHLTFSEARRQFNSQSKATTLSQIVQSVETIRKEELENKIEDAIKKVEESFNKKFEDMKATQEQLLKTQDLLMRSQEQFFKTQEKVMQRMDIIIRQNTAKCSCQIKIAEENNKSPKRKNTKKNFADKKDDQTDVTKVLPQEQNISMDTSTCTSIAESVKLLRTRS